MSKDWLVYAEHILGAIERVKDYRHRVAVGRADEDIATDAIYRLLEIICEAASDKVPLDVQQRHSEIDWKAISGMRVRLAHVYLAIDPAVVEATIANDLDPLYEAIRTEMPDWSKHQRGGR